MADKKADTKKADAPEIVEAPEPANPVLEGPPVGPERIEGIDPINPLESDPADPTKKDKVLTMRNKQTGEERRVRSTHWDMDEKALTAHGWELV